MSDTPATPTEAFVAKLMEADKLILATLGIELSEVRSGGVTLSMKVSDAMVNSQSICHGGFIFSLADTASAYDTASLGVAPATTEANISYLSGARLGETLLAVAEVEHDGAKVTHSVVRVQNESGDAIALYRGANIKRGRL